MAKAAEPRDRVRKLIRSAYDRVQSGDLEGASRALRAAKDLIRQHGLMGDPVADEFEAAGEYVAMLRGGPTSADPSQAVTIRPGGP